jgi:hypothetical protein
MPVGTMIAENIVPIRQGSADSHGHRLLAAIEMTGAVNLTGEDWFNKGLFAEANA